MKKLKIISSTTRPERKGKAIEQWITEYAAKHSEFEVELLDLEQIGLPLMNEVNHPRLQQYEHEHAKQWSRKIDEADAFIIVLAEYNFGYPAPIKNALDYLYKEWQYKPVGIVSYGGVSGGLRATQMLKQVLTTLKMMPLTEAVVLPFFQKKINSAGKFEADEMAEQSAAAMLKELDKWAEAMKTMRG